MNKKFADTVLRMMLIFVFVMGTVWVPTTSAGASPPLAMGDGLYAEYRNLGETGIVFTVDGEGPINHGWTGACPDTIIYQNQCGLWAGTWNSWSLFEETLTGYIEAPETGTYLFQSWIDDYLEITINGVTDIADDPGGAVYSIEINLVEGQFYPIVMNFKNRWGSNDLSLWWILPGGTNEIVPKQYLYTELPQTPELTLEKTASPTTYNQAGDVIDYSYLLTNTGSGTLSGPFTVTDDKTTVACPSGNLDGTVLFDHFENSHLAQSVFGTPSYVNGLAGFGQAIDFSSGAWLRYNVPGWYQWPSTYDPVGKEGSVDLWVYPKQYGVGFVNFNWSSTDTPPGGGHILHLSLTTEGKLYGGSWSAINGPALIPLPAGNTTIPLNQWSHVAYVWGEDGTSLYVNGVVDAFSPDNLYPALNSTFYAYVPYWGYPGIGYIDDLRITSSSQTNFGVSALAEGESITCNGSYVITQNDVDAGSVTNTAQARAFFGADPIDSNQGLATVTLSHQHDPSIQVWVTENSHSVNGRNWPEDSLISLAIEDPATPASPDLTTVQQTTPCWWGSDQGCVYFDMGDFQFAVGQIITMSDETYTKVFTITSLDLKITNVDPSTDIVSGTAAPNSALGVEIGGVLNGPMRFINADPSGHWSVNFSIAGPAPREGTFDIIPGTSIWNAQSDNDGDCISDYFTVPEAANSFIIVQPNEDRVFGSAWPVGALLELEIDDPATPQSPDYTDSQIFFESDNWGNGFELSGLFDIQPSHLVTISSGGLTKQLAVAPLTVTAVDIDADTVSGTGDPGFEIHVGMLCDDNSCTRRNIYVDANGNWLADFSVPGINEEETVFDIRPGSGTGVYEIDEDADATNVSWSIPNPYFNVRANNEQIEAWEWNIGSTLTVNIYSSGTETSLPDYTISDVVTGPTPWGDTRNYLSFDLNGIYDIKPGYLVTVSDGTIIKQHIVKPLVFDVMDVNADTISGFAEPGSNVDAWACDNSNCYNRHVIASDPGGIWIANWHIPGLQGDENNTLDLVRGTWVDSSQYDDDGDSTMFGQSIPNPYIEASPADNWIHAREWPIGTLITMNISGSSEIYTAIMGPAPWNPNDPNDIVADFDLQGYDIQAGDVITASGNGMTKTLTVSQLAITDFDLNADTLSGVATPEVQIQVCANVPDRCITRWITADDSGNWLANYQVPGMGNDDPATFDIQPDSNGWVAERDEDRDQTWVNWNIPNPAFGARPNEESVELWQWPLGATVTIEIDDPATPQINPDFTGTAIASIPSWNPNETRFTLNFSGQYDLKPGDLVTVTEGNTIKTHTVTGFQITNINIDADIVSGITDTGGSVDLWICGNNGCVNRNELVDQNGEWSANFAVPGDEDGEQGTFDIKPGIGGDSAQWDEDGDGTVIGWRVPNPIISARPFERQITGYDWPDGALITMTIDVPLTTASPDYIATSTAQMQYFGQTEATFNLIDLFNLKAGDIVAMTDGVTIKTHTVTNLEIQSVDVDTDQVSGVADPGHTIQIFVWASQDNSTAWRDVTADSNGSWVADFSISMDGMTYDVLAETWGETIEYDEDGDNTNVYWRAPNPNITVYPDDEIIEGNDWPLDSVLTVQIGNPDQPDYTTTTTLNPPDQDHTLPWFRLDLSSVYDLQPGEMVTAFDAETTKQLIVVNRNITLIDMVTDTITGTWDQNITFVVLWACDDNGCAVRREEVTTDVNWSANFALPGELNWENILLDIQSGTTGGIYQNDEDGDGTSYTWSLNQPPQADLGPDLVTDEGSTLMLDASASSDPESDLMTYAWDLDNDGEYDDAVGVTTSKSFPDNGTYTVGLKVTDQYGESDTDTAQINVVNVSPLVNIQETLANNLGVLSGNGAFTDPGADTWTATVNYGDGTGIQSLAFNPDKTFPLSHTYIANGNYTVEVCVSDDDSASGCDQAQVTVTLNRPPIAEAGGPYVGYEGTSITLNASRSTDPDGNIILYEWDLDNDGLFDDATGVRPKFTAIDNGIFTVRVRVTDAGGLSSEDSSTVTVKNVPPVITSLTINNSVRVGVKLNAYATFKDVGINDTFTATWKWGDGTTSAGTINDKTVNGSHIYAKPGIYLITITIKDKDGGVGQAYKLILVLPKR